ncbi:MAG: hypothetical protein RBS38_02720 [Bacteroidales bacterium]|jgi:hypothetical protein|nr:hypothetical protein [Bacteroidales bacterium]
MIPGSIKIYKSFRQISLAFLLIVILLSSWVPAAGQTTRPETPPLKDRLFYGGNLNLQFGTYTDIQVSPVIGLWVLPRVGVAIGPDFQYYKLGPTHTFIYGGKTYLEYLFLQDLDNVIPLGMHVGLFLHAEYELLSLESSFFKDPPYDSDRFLAGTALFGGGIRQQLGERSSLNMTFLWTLDSDAYGIYGNPEIRISFMF